MNRARDRDRDWLYTCLAFHSKSHVACIKYGNNQCSIHAFYTINTWSLGSGNDWWDASVGRQSALHSSWFLNRNHWIFNNSRKILSSEKHLKFSSNRLISRWKLMCCSGFDCSGCCTRKNAWKNRHPDHSIDNKQLGYESFCNVSNNNSLRWYACPAWLGRQHCINVIRVSATLIWGDLMFSTQTAPYYLWCLMSTLDYFYIV